MYHKITPSLPPHLTPPSLPPHPSFRHFFSSSLLLPHPSLPSSSPLPPSSPPPSLPSHLLPPSLLIPPSLPLHPLPSSLPLFPPSPLQYTGPPTGAGVSEGEVTRPLRPLERAPHVAPRPPLRGGREWGSREAGKRTRGTDRHCVLLPGDGVRAGDGGATAVRLYWVG